MRVFDIERIIELLSADADNSFFLLHRDHPFRNESKVVNLQYGVGTTYQRSSRAALLSHRQLSGKNTYFERP
jgi:hypothetical protein